MKLNARKNWLWLWVLPTALSWWLVSTGGPAGEAPFLWKLAIICLSCCVCGFALAIKGFGTIKERFWGGLFFSGGSLCVIFSVMFVGCLYFPSTPEPAPIRPLKPPPAVPSKKVAARQFPRRDSRADSTMLDLTAYYDDPLPGQSDWKSPGESALRPGTHIWQGIKFDVRGLVVGRDRTAGKVTGITVGKKCSGIAFFYGAYFLQTNKPASFIIHFANGASETIPLVYGRDIAPSYVSANTPELNLAMTNSVVWGEKAASNGGVRPEFVFYVKTWNNPRPGIAVSGVDFVPPPELASAFLAAITVLPENPR